MKNTMQAQESAQTEKREDKYDAFLSYSSKDEALVRDVQNVLENWVPTVDPVGKKRKLKVFRDNTHIVAGKLPELLKNALKNSRFLIIFCTKNAERSDYVYKELRLFYENYPGETPQEKKKAFDYILLAGCEKEDHLNKAVIVSIFKRAFEDLFDKREMNALLEEVKEYLYADFGSVKGSFQKRQVRMEAFKLAGGILGVDKEKLSKRLEHRRQLLIWGRVFVGITIMVLSYFVVTGYHGRRDRDARRLALVAEAQLEEGNRLLASQIALSTTEPKFLYRTVQPEAVSVLTDAAQVYGVSSDACLEQAADFTLRYNENLSMDVSDNGRYLAVMNEQYEFTLWDTESGEKLWYMHSPTGEFYPIVRIIGNEKVLTYDYSTCYCHDLKSSKELWSKRIDLPSKVLSIEFEDEASMDLMIGGENSGGLANIAVVERKGSECLLFLERSSGVSLLDPETGKKNAVLTREEIDRLLPEDGNKRDIFIDNSIYPLQRVTKLQRPSEIFYDAEKDLFLIPCYGKKRTNFTVNTYTGLLEWNPTTSEAEYIELKYSFPDDDEKARGRETLIYPADGIVMKALEAEDSLVLCAFDTESGKELWNREITGFSNMYSVERQICQMGTELVVINGDKVLFLDLLSGEELRSVKAELDYNENLSMILYEKGKNCRTNARSLPILTTAGRICFISDGGIVKGKRNRLISVEEIRNSGNALYVPPEMSYSETGMLYSSGASRIRKYELGFSNALYKELFSKKGSGDSIEKIVKLHPIGGDRILTKGGKGTWELYDLSGNEPELLWSRGPAELSKLIMEKENHELSESKLESLSFVGIEPGTGKILLYQKEFHGFIELEPQTGDVSVHVLEFRVPEPFDDGGQEGSEGTFQLRLMSPVMTENGFCYISVCELNGVISYNIYIYNTIIKAFREIPLSDIGSGPLADVDNKVELYTDPKARYFVVLGLTEGPWLVNSESDKFVMLNSRLESGRIEEVLLNTMFTDNSHDAVCCFDSEGRRFAVNFPGMDTIAVFSVEGELISWTGYSNTTITGMAFSGDSILTSTFDGRIMRYRIRDLKHTQTATIPGNGTCFTLERMDQDSMWLRDAGGTAYCIDTDSLSCGQRIYDTKAIDFENGWVYLYEDSDVMTTLGRTPLLTDEEVLSKAREYVGDREMSAEDKKYYGID